MASWQNYDLSHINVNTKAHQITKNEGKAWIKCKPRTRQFLVLHHTLNNCPPIHILQLYATRWLSKFHEAHKSLSIRICIWKIPFLKCNNTKRIWSLPHLCFEQTTHTMVPGKLQKEAWSMANGVAPVLMPLDSPTTGQKSFDWHFSGWWGCSKPPILVGGNHTKRGLGWTGPN